MTPSRALDLKLRPVISAQWINLVLCVSLISVAFALGRSAPPAVWVRSTIILIVSLFMVLCGLQMRRGRRWAYMRAKWIAILGSIGFVGVAALPGPFPAWMRIEQGGQALVFLALAWMLTRPQLASFFPLAKASNPVDEANPPPPAGARDASLDYLRAFIVLLVLLHHSMLAYVDFWRAQPRTFAITSAPIVDPGHWAGFDIIAMFNDTFFMALMFLLSGLFVWSSLERKGSRKFLRDRALRLGVPFVAAVGILAPLAYYPAYAVIGDHPGFRAYVHALLSLGYWPAGPAWFIWLLLFFDAIAAGLYALRHRWSKSARLQSLRAIQDRAPTFVPMLIVVSAVVYVPMELAFGAENWPILGPFSLQISRLFLYATYFAVGIRLGAAGTQSGLLARNAGLARRWPIWLAVGLGAFALRLAVVVALILPVVTAHRPLPLIVRLLSDLTVVLCCGAISVAFIALFRRFAVGHRSLFDSLSASSYGMYLVHYPVVVWLQFALLMVALGPIAKGAIVFVGAVVLSWGSVVALRRVPVIARVL
jgi:peptidoglycan/LPS O-acetylase OafA/YrhL